MQVVQILHLRYLNKIKQQYQIKSPNPLNPPLYLFRLIKILNETTGTQFLTSKIEIFQNVFYRITSGQESFHRENNRNRKNTFKLFQNKRLVDPRGSSNDEKRNTSLFPLSLARNRVDLNVCDRL